ECSRLFGFYPIWERTALKFQRVGFFRFVDRVCAEGGNASLYHGFVFLWRTLCAVIRRKLRKIGAHNLRREVTVLGEDQQPFWIGAPRRTAVRKFGCRGDERPGPHELLLDLLLLTNDVARQERDSQGHQYRRAEHTGPIHILLPVSNGSARAIGQTDRKCCRNFVATPFGAAYSGKNECRLVGGPMPADGTLAARSRAEIRHVPLQGQLHKIYQISRA